MYEYNSIFNIKTFLNSNDPMQKQIPDLNLGKLNELSSEKSCCWQTVSHGGDMKQA